MASLLQTRLLSIHIDLQSVYLLFPMFIFDLAYLPPLQAEDVCKWRTKIITAKTFLEIDVTLVSCDEKFAGVSIYEQFSKLVWSEDLSRHYPDQWILTLDLLLRKSMPDLKIPYLHKEKLASLASITAYVKIHNH